MSEAENPSLPRAPRVAVFIPTRNRPALLAEALASVLAQTRPADVILVSDNAPAEPAEQVVASAGKGRCRYVRHDALMSMEDHWLWGLTAVEADYLCFLSDDDLWRPRHLEHLLAAAEKFPGRGLYGAACLPCTGPRMPITGELFAPIWTCEALTGEPGLVPGPRYAATTLIGPPFASCAVMLNLARMADVRPRASGCSILLDAWLWFQFAAAHDAVYVPEITTLYRVHHGNAVRGFSRALYRRDNELFLDNVARYCRGRGIDLESAVRELPDVVSGPRLDFYAQGLLRAYGQKGAAPWLALLAKGRDPAWLPRIRRAHTAGLVSRGLKRVWSRVT